MYLYRSIIKIRRRLWFRPNKYLCIVIIDPTLIKFLRFFQTRNDRKKKIKSLLTSFLFMIVFAQMLNKWCPFFIRIDGE